MPLAEAAIVAAVVLLALGWWCFVCWMIGRFGWARLARDYRAAQRPAGETFRMQSIRLGWSNYGGCTTICVADAGLYLAVWPMFRAGHPPLLIPWSEIFDARPRGALWFREIELTVGSDQPTKIRVPLRVFRAANAHLGALDAAESPDLKAAADQRG